MREFDETEKAEEIAEKPEENASEEISAPEDALTEAETIVDDASSDENTVTDTEAASEENPDAETAESVLEEASDETTEASEEEATEPEKKNFKVNWKTVGKVFMSAASVFIMVLGICLVLYFIWGPARNEFHSDSTDTLLWAEAAMQGNGLINPDFKYAAVMPLGGNLFMQLWIPLFGVSMTTHSLGMTTFFAAFVLALIWLLHEMKFSLRWTGVTVGGLLMFISASEKLREIFWGHIIYYSLGMLFLMIGLSLVLHIYNLQDKPKKTLTTVRKVISLVVLLVVFVLCCTNSTTAIALFALPILGAIFCERFLDHSQPLRNKKTGIGAIMLGLCGAGVIGGMKLGSILAGDVIGSYATAYSNLSGSDTWKEHAEGLPMAFLYLLGLDVVPGEPLVSLASVNTIILIAVAIIIAVLPIIALCCYGKIKDTATRMIIWCHLVVLAFILVGYICGGLSTANWRLSPLLVTGFLSSVAFMRWIYLNTEMRRLGLLLLIPMGYFCFNSALNISKMPKDEYLDNNHYAVGQFLKEQGLEYGYATFWNAGAITIQADSECKVRNVNIDENGVHIYDYQGNKNWYNTQEGQDDYFLLMSAGERDSLLLSGSELLTRPYKELLFRDYIIWVYDTNIFNQ